MIRIGLWFTLLVALRRVDVEDAVEDGVCLDAPVSRVVPPEAACDRIHVLDAERMPVARARVEVRGAMFAVEHGEGRWPHGCGTHRVSVRVGDVQYAPITVEVVEGAPGVVTIPADGHATAEFVDEDGRALDGVVDRTAWLRSAEREGSRWRIHAPGESVRIGFVAQGRPRAGFELPLDGRHHRFVVSLARSVRVLAECLDAGCPELSCASEPCRIVAPEEYVCECPGGFAEILGGSPVWSVPEDARVVAVDLRGVRTGVRAAWTGSLPCDARIQWGRGQTADLCGADGSIAGSVGTGAFLLRVSGADGDEGRVLFEARGGELDLGAVRPGGEGAPPPRIAEVVDDRDSGDTG